MLFLESADAGASLVPGRTNQNRTPMTSQQDSRLTQTIAIRPNPIAAFVGVTLTWIADRPDDFPDAFKLIWKTYSERYIN